LQYPLEEEAMDPFCLSFKQCKLGRVDEHGRWEELAAGSVPPRNWSNNKIEISRPHDLAATAAGRPVPPSLSVPQYMRRHEYMQHAYQGYYQLFPRTTLKRKRGRPSMFQDYFHVIDTTPSVKCPGRHAAFYLGYREAE
jgi:hypothetical protein